MFYYLSVIGILITPPSQGIVENSVTGSFDTLNEVSGGTTVPGTAGFVDTISITLSNFDSGAADELLLLRINRDHDDGDDTATGDVELLSVSLEYTTS